MSYENMKLRIDTSGKTIRQTKINDARFMFEHEFAQDPSYNSNYQYCNGIKPDYNIDIRIFEKRYSAANGFTQKYAVKYDDALQVGDMLYDTSTKNYWLITESFDNNEIYVSGKMVRCVNNTMKWQNEKGVIFEYPIFEINSTQYNSGETGNRTMTLGSSQHLITVIADENTITLNHGQRFFWDRNTVDPTVFKITQNDTTAMNYDKGLLKITIMEDQFNPDTDSIEHWLCNYFPVAESKLVISYSGNATLRMGGSKTLTVDTTSVVTWSVDNPDITLIPDGNKVVVKCPNDENYIDTSIIITATVDGSKAECELTIVGGV